MMESKIKESKLIGIIRTDETAYTKIEDTAKSILSGGINIIEVALNTPSAFQYIEKLKTNIPGVYIGAGTVLDSESARMAIDSGADFLLSPILNIEAIKLANRYNVLTIPGILSPSEAVLASEYGCNLLKVFPASSLGPSYIKDLLGPLHQLSYMPVGGIDLSNAEAYLKAGSCALGLGSSLADSELIQNKDYKEIEYNSRRFREIVESLR